MDLGSAAAQEAQDGQHEQDDEHDDQDVTHGSSKGAKDRRRVRRQPSMSRPVAESTTPAAVISASARAPSPGVRFTWRMASARTVTS